MEKNSRITMKFNSQICTTKIQSERLLALGLKKETADMKLIPYSRFAVPVDYYTNIYGDDPDENDFCRAWSLHRLIEMMPNKIRVFNSSASLIVSNEKVQYYLHDVEYSDYLTGAGRWKDGNIYDNIIDCIGWLIIEGYFNKEYLEE